jgi:anti-sigma factor RsiW
VISNMTSQFNPHPKFNLSIARPTGEPRHDAEGEENLPWLDDRFELLSAYLDGEVNDPERQQVEAWLATDTQFRQVYDRMSRLNQSISSIPVPAPAICAQSLSDRIFDVDRVELLSAYLDGEVNDPERQQVEAWLATDTQFRQVHDRMSRLNQSVQSIPVPAPALSARSLADKVFDRLDRQRQQRNLRWGGAIAAAFIAVVSGITLATRAYTPQMAKSSQEGKGGEPKIAFERDAGRASVSSNVRSGTSIVSRALFVE